MKVIFNPDKEAVEMIKKGLEKNNNIMCSEEECTVIRPFYKKTDKTIFFNFDINDTHINKTKLRTQYSNLKIEKTSTVGDNNVVSKGSKIKYTIEKELGIELVGDVKVKIEVNQEEEAWDEIKEADVDEKEIEEKIDDNFIKENLI